MADPAFPPGPQVPDFEGFLALSRDATVVPVALEIIADGVTPVVAAATCGAGEGSYLLESVAGGEKWGRFSFVGFDPELIVRGVGERFERLRRFHQPEVLLGDPWALLREELTRWRAPEVPWLPRFWGGAVGYVPYDAVGRFEPSAFEQRPETVEFCFALGGTVLVFDDVQKTLNIVALVHLGQDVEPAKAYQGALERIEHTRVRLSRPAQLTELLPPARAHVPDLPASSFEPEAFRSAVDTCQEHIRAGDIFQVVLSQRFRVPLLGTDPFDVYRAMRVINPSPYMYFLRFPDVTIAGASPETLVRLEDGVAQVRPIAGTRPRGATEEEDQAIAQELLADPKERAEHVMLVDLGRNDLGRIARSGTVQITERMTIERYSHVMHIVSNVSAELEPGRDAIDVLRATFPAGTLSGAPKVRAMQIIDELEPEPRGVYGGAVGYLSFDGNMDLAIAIRTVVAEGEELTLQAGAGIVEASDPQSEWEETVNKARAGLVALEVARNRS